jgi:GH15 family glucan-1,4-alpha-glucosidase
MDVLHQARVHGLDPSDHAWSLQRTLLDFLEGAWDRPDEGIWEVRGPRRHFVHSKVLAWVAFDRAVQGAERLGLDGPVERWRQLRQEIHDEVCREGFNTALGSFTQSYGSDELDASTLLIPILGFLPPDDPRVVGTVDAVQRDLMRDGFVERYRTRAHNEVDGLTGGEGAFLPCSFWLADALLLIGRRAEAEQLFERLLGIRNDLGLLAEEYDPAEKRLLGNFPQAFTHVGLVNTAYNLSQHESPHRQRPQRA